MAARIELVLTESDVSIVNNTSKVTAKLYYYGNGVSYSGYQKKWTITIDGTTYSGTNTFTTSTSAQLLGTASKVVTHNDNGAKTVAVSASFETKVSIGTLTTSKSLPLTTIPRVSDLSIDKTSVPADGSTTVIATATKKSSSFTDELTVSLGSYSQIIESGVAFTIPEEWINAIAGTSAVATVKVTTKSGSTTIGSKTVSLTVTVPASVVPVINDVTITEAVAAVTTAFGSRFVQNLSQLNVSIDAEGVYGSTIKSYSTTLDGVNYIQQAFTSNVLKTAGSLTLAVTVTDSRGRTASTTVTVTVIEYNYPAITGMAYIHCDADGTQNSNGTSTKVTISGKVYPVEEQNTKALKLKYRAMSEETYTERAVTISDWTFTVDVIINNTDPTITYEYIAELTDKINESTPETYRITTGIVVISRRAGGKGVTFGGEAEQDGFVCKWPAQFDSGLTAGAELDMTADEIAEINTSIGTTGNRLANFLKSIALKLGLIADYVVEQGTSGIWTYEKWNSGKAVCWGTSKLPASTTPEINVILPFNMVDTNYVVSLTPGNNASILTTPIRECRVSGGNSVRTVNSFYVSAKCSSSYSVRFDMTVIGRWK